MTSASADIGAVYIYWVPAGSRGPCDDIGGISGGWNKATKIHSAPMLDSKDMLLFPVESEVVCCSA